MYERKLDVDMVNAAKTHSLRSSTYQYKPYVDTMYIFYAMPTQTKTTSHRD